MCVLLLSAKKKLNSDSNEINDDFNALIRGLNIPLSAADPSTLLVWNRRLEVYALHAFKILPTFNAHED